MAVCDHGCGSGQRNGRAILGPSTGSVTLKKPCVSRNLNFMAKTLKSLPSLRSLRAFHAAGRRLNLTRAAGDLNVSREAISAQIKSLEEHLGTPLFRRLHRGLEFTAAGRKLHDKVSNGFDDIATAVQEIASPDGQTGVCVTTTVAFAAARLVGEMSEYRRLHPNIDIRIMENDACLDLGGSEIDFGIRYGRGDWRQVDALHLFDEEVFPVCSPGYLAGNPEISDIARIPGHCLLHLDGAAHEWENWHHLFAAAGISVPRGVGRPDLLDLFECADCRLGWPGSRHGLAHGHREVHRIRGAYQSDRPLLQNRAWILSGQSRGPVALTDGAEVIRLAQEETGCDIIILQYLIFIRLF